jgi:omega-hydroxy-beta-dihydromenaquinone-9 sulfotransferase
VIIVSGNSRSGTTMTGRILGNHPLVFTFQELHFFDELMSKENLFIKRDSSALSGLYAKLISTQRDGYFKRGKGLSYRKESEEAVHLSDCETQADVYKTFVLNETKRENKGIPCEQTPQNIFALDELFRMFPEARAVILMRDPREVLLSQKNKWKRRKFTTDTFPASEALRARLNYHPVTISKIWKAVSATASSWQKDERVLIVKFEDL